MYGAGPPAPPPDGASAFRAIAAYPQGAPRPKAAASAGCRCKNSKCLKRYCVCFERGEACGPECRCVGCGNVDGTEARAAALRTNRKRKKVAGAGCTCTRSRCLKRYCDCFAAGEACAPSCRCVDCGNSGGPRPALAPPPPDLARVAAAGFAAARARLAAAPPAAPVPIAPRSLPPPALAPAPEACRFAPVAPIVPAAGDAADLDSRRSPRSVLDELNAPPPPPKEPLARSVTFEDPGRVGLLLEHSDGSDAIVVTSVADGGPAKKQRVAVGARVAAINACDVTTNVDFDAALSLCALRPLTLRLIEESV